MAGYGSDIEFSQWLSDQGLTMPSGTPSLTALRQIGSDYVDAAYEHRLQCSRRAGGVDQERAWPRAGHVVQGETVVGVPQSWVNASYRAAWLEATQPGWASGSQDARRQVRRQKVDVVEREFFSVAEAGGDDVAALVGSNSDPLIEGMVGRLLCSQARRIGMYVI